MTVRVRGEQEREGETSSGDVHTSVRTLDARHGVPTGSEAYTDHGPGSGHVGRGRDGTGPLGHRPRQTTVFVHVFGGVVSPFGPSPEDEVYPSEVRRHGVGHL